MPQSVREYLETAFTRPGVLPERGEVEEYSIPVYSNLVQRGDLFEAGDLKPVCGDRRLNVQSFLRGDSLCVMQRDFLPERVPAGAGSEHMLARNPSTRFVVTAAEEVEPRREGEPWKDFNRRAFLVHAHEADALGSGLGIRIHFCQTAAPVPLSVGTLKVVGKMAL